MHDTDAQGADMFVCDFCASPWREDRPMVEGHRGALICANCLSIAFTELVHLKLGSPVDPDEKCVLCLEHGRDERYWRSPIRDEGVACLRCIKQSSGVLHKDPESDWTKPPDPSRPDPTPED